MLFFRGFPLQLGLTAIAWGSHKTPKHRVLKGSENPENAKFLLWLVNFEKAVKRADINFYCILINKFSNKLKNRYNFLKKDPKLFDKVS